MTIVSSQEFAANQNKYYDLAIDEDVCIKRGNNMFQLIYAATTPDENIVYFEPDEDFYNSISIEEFKIRAREVVKQAYERYTNERNNITEST